MLRSLLILLFLLNTGFWIWHLPGVAAWHSPGIEPGRDPARLKRQVNPLGVQLLSAREFEQLAHQPKPAAAASAAPHAASTASAAASSADGLDARIDAAAHADTLVCLQTAALTEEEFQRLTQRMQTAGFSRTDWEDRRREFPGRWGLHLGPYRNQDQLQRRMEILRKLEVPFEEAKTPAELTPGLLLGRFDAEADARKQQAVLSKRGVRAAKVVVLREPSVEHRLRIDALTPPQARKVRDIGAGLRWRTCED